MLEVSQILFRLFLAAGLGALFGLEREHRHKKAGMRTNILVSVGSALIMIISVFFEAEPARIAAGIVTGIGFLGAGLIIQSQGEISGVTTAATIWLVSAIGMAVGAGYFSAGLAASFVGLATLYILGNQKFRKAAKLNDY